MDQSCNIPTIVFFSPLLLIVGIIVMLIIVCIIRRKVIKYNLNRRTKKINNCKTIEELLSYCNELENVHERVMNTYSNVIIDCIKNINGMNNHYTCQKSNIQILQIGMIKYNHNTYRYKATLIHNCPRHGVIYIDMDNTIDSVFITHDELRDHFNDIDIFVLFMSALGNLIMYDINDKLITETDETTYWEIISNINKV